LKTPMRSLFCGTLAVAWIGSAALAPARAQEISPQSLLNERYQQFLEQGLKAGSEERACDDTWKVVGEFLKVAQEIERQRTAVTGHVRFGFNGDEAGIERSFKGSIDTRLNIGVYPRQLRLAAGASLRFEDKQDGRDFNEDVTSILANYDHYLTPRLELFGFVERFTDSFLRIDQRYEIGLGVKLERTSRARGERYERRRHRILPASEYGSDHCRSAYTAEGCRMLERLSRRREEAARLIVDSQRAKCLAQGMSPSENLADYLLGSPGEAAEVVAAVNEDTPEARRAQAMLDPLYETLRKSHARFEAGLSLALLSEFEQPGTLDVEILTPSTGAVTQQSYRPPTQQVFRVSVRPMIQWRINDLVKLDLEAFGKWALDSERAPGDPEDFRIDAIARMEWTLGSLLPASRKRTSLSLQYEWHYDSLPPDARTMIGTLGPDQQLVAITRAEKMHRVTKLQVGVEW